MSACMANAEFIEILLEVCGDRLAAAGTFREMVFFNEEARIAG